MQTILCSAMGLGFYNPGLIVEYYLSLEDIPTQVLVFENYIEGDKRQNIKDNIKAFHDNFRIAIKATTVPRDIRDSFDNVKIDELLKKWYAEGRKDFTVLSGYWMFIIDIYRQRYGLEDTNVDMLYVDSDYSPSWSSYRKFRLEEHNDYKEIWLFNYEKQSLIYELPISNKPIIPYQDRENRFVIHGGGWGMGTYQKRIKDLQDKKILLDVIINYYEEAEDKVEGNRYFMNNPEWSPWLLDDDNQHEFPPFSEVNDNIAFSNKKEYHMLYDVIRSDKAIISKPGGATLIDSLASATPIILLKAFGKHEKKNGELWCALGFGIMFEDWEKSNFSIEILDELHKNILKYRNANINYTQEVIRRYKGNATKDQKQA